MLARAVVVELRLGPTSEHKVVRREFVSFPGYVVRRLSPDHASNVAYNAQVRRIVAKYGLTLDQYRILHEEIHRAKRSAAYDLDINGNLYPADIEQMAKAIKKEHPR